VAYFVGDPVHIDSVTWRWLPNDISIKGCIFQPQFILLFTVCLCQRRTAR